MSNLDDTEKLHAEMLREELSAYRRLETWGASLFFGGIGLVAKQFVEWDRSAVPSHRLPLVACVSADGIGVYCIWLFGDRKTRTHQFALGYVLYRWRRSCDRRRCSYSPLAIVLETEFHRTRPELRHSRRGPVGGAEPRRTVQFRSDA